MQKIEKFNFCFIENKALKRNYTRVAELAEIPFKTVTLPHDIAFSVSRFKTEEELNFGSNICELQKYENLHCYYYTQFSHKPGRYLLHFDRVDVYSEIFLNGVKILETDNAFISYETQAELAENNELIIHIFPAMIRAGEYEIPAVTNMLAFSYPSAYMRKPMHLFGWDICPRNVLGGIFAPVEIREIKEDEIKSLYIYTNKIENVVGYGAETISKVLVFVIPFTIFIYTLGVKLITADLEKPKGKFKIQPAVPAIAT